jgi:hypothetical protein
LILLVWRFVVLTTNLNYLILSVAVERSSQMSQQSIAFRVTDLAASVPEGVPVEWQGREFSSGPLLIELDESQEEQGNRGMLDYAESRAQVEFRVRVKFPEFAAMLESLEVDPALTRPIQAVVRSEGAILDDHSFALSGQSELRPHALFKSVDTAASILPGR